MYKWNNFFFIENGAPPPYMEKIIWHQSVQQRIKIMFYFLAAIELVVVLVFGIMFRDIIDLLRTNSNISVDLYVNFYLAIVATVAAMCICFMSFIDYKKRCSK